MISHKLPQGSPEWKAHRAQHFNASDAPAMLGCSPFKTRAQLLQELHTGYAPEVDAGTQRRFDDGHRFEALARPLAEEIIGDDLAPVVGSLEGTRLSASFDGLTLMGDTAFEHKSLNGDLRECMEGEDESGRLPKHYRAQMEQQLLVSGAKRCLFMASKWEGDSLVEERHCWYASDPVLRAEILAGWAQFEKDLAGYTPAEVKEMPKAEVTLALPALFIHAKGEITTSNMEEYGEALAKRLAEVRAIALITDQDFSNAKESAKLLRENIQQAKLAKDAMLAQTVTVGEAARMIDTWCEDMRLTALKLEQDVEREDRLKKAAMIAKAKSAYEQHIAALTKETGGPWIVLPVPDWAGAIKGKRNFASMQDALDTMLANAKIAADESARKIRASLACLKEDGAGFEFLFNDRLALIGKPLEDLQLLVRSRISEHQAAEQRRAAELAERERERIRAEEAAKVRAEQEALALQERQRQENAAREQRQREEEARRQEDAAALRESEELAARGASAEREAIQTAMDAAQDRRAQPPAAAPIASPAVSSQAANVVPMGTRAPDTGARLRLGEINARLAPIALTADGLAALGFQPVATEKAAKLYAASDFQRICSALVAHVSKVSGQQRAA